MSVDLGQVVGRGIKSITLAGTRMTILYTDNTSSVFDISNEFDVVDAVEDNNSLAVTSNAVHDALAWREVVNTTGAGGCSIVLRTNGRLASISSVGHTQYKKSTTENTIYTIPDAYKGNTKMAGGLVVMPSYLMSHESRMVFNGATLTYRYNSKDANGTNYECFYCIYELDTPI